MKTLKIDELKEGKIYWCNLSGRPVLITDIGNVSGKNMFTGEPFSYKSVSAVAFYNGEYDEPAIYDNMLSELSEKETK